MDQDQRVRVIAAAARRDLLRVARVQGPQDVVRQDVAVPVGTALQAHQQDVLRADGRAADDRVRTADAAHVLDDEVGEAAYRQHQRGGDAAQDVSSLPGSTPQRLRRACPHHRVLPQESQGWMVTVGRSLPSRSRYQRATTNIQSTYERPTMARCPPEQAIWRRAWRQADTPGSARPGSPAAGR